MLSRRHCLIALPGLAWQACAEAKPDAGLTLVGQAQMRWFGLLIYDIRLWSERKPARDWWTAPLALELEYARSLKGSEIAKRSLVEMRRQQLIDEASAARWLTQMQERFPDVKAGDRLSGRHLPGEGTDFFFNGSALPRLADPLFSRLFFGIWLSEQTSEPQLRAKLLGLSA
ncbi:chalcone isomerase family protein [Roseateles sp.]|jgi:hypothetical protein|uniref:chalcone isomerase family protein n=1 Tax=Roseateles sp. TaxID=1971397 RepID=UPI0037C827DB